MSSVTGPVRVNCIVDLHVYVRRETMAAYVEEMWSLGLSSEVRAKWLMDGINRLRAEASDCRRTQQTPGGQLGSWGPGSVS